MKSWLGLVAMAATVLSVASCAEDSVIDLGAGGSMPTTTGTGNSGNGPIGGEGPGGGGGVGATGGGATGGGATGGGATGGSGGSAPDCNIGDCSDCAISNCATDRCIEEYDACDANDDCFALADCEYDCGTDPACITDCYTQYADGSTDYYALLNCLYCADDTCGGDCADYCPMAPPPTGACNQNDCAACSESDCAYFWCAPALDACFESADCDDFMTCIDGCSDPACDYSCHQDEAAGATLYYALLNCIYCSADTCAADCVEVCPIEQPTASPCDTGGACNECGQSDCAYYWCDPAVTACFDSVDCDAFMDCYYACATPECEYDCHASEAAGATLYYEMLNCVYCSTDTCSVDCADACPIEPPPASPCNTGGSCNDCGQSDCAWFWCGVETNACFDSADCDAFMDCYYACTTPQCEYDCHASEAAGATLYYEMLNCVYCSTDTCSVDCVDACPVTPPPDKPCSIGDCSGCGQSDCAWFWCGVETNACFDSQDCNDFMNCYDACTDVDCDYACHQSFAAGATLYYEMLNCVYCGADTCFEDCDAVGACPIAQPPAPPCDTGGSCADCVASDCAYYWCDPELQACFGNPDCQDFMDCLDACGNDAACQQGCVVSYPAGYDRYVAAVDCLYCNADTCSQDCAAECGGGTDCNVGDCETCINSACADAACTAEYDACAADQGCVDYYDCIYPCTDQACYDQCDAQYPAGSILFWSWIDCLYCSPDACSVDCAMYCGGSTSCDVGDCGSCINSPCAADYCAAEVAACDNEPQCWDYVNCALPCTNNGCLNACRNQYPNGEAPGQAVGSCLLCEPSTCSQDCAAMCPWP